MSEEKPATKAGLLWEKDRDSLLDLLGQPGGRWFIARLLDTCGVWPPRVSDWTSERNAAMDEGARRVGIRLVRQLEATGKEEALAELMREYRETVEWMDEVAKKREGMCSYEEISF